MKMNRSPTSSRRSRCTSHHTLVHEGGYGVEMVENEPRFIRPDGKVIGMWVPTGLPEIRLRDREIERDRMTLCSRWDGERFDVGETVATLV